MKAKIVIAIVAVVIIAACAAWFVANNKTGDTGKKEAVTDTMKSNDKNEEKTEEKNAAETKKSEKDEESKSANTENKGVNENKAPSNDEKASSSASTESEAKVYTPTFMYFVSKKDAGYEATTKMLDELKKQYDGKIKFDIVDVDENPDAKKNFPVDGQTPALIMLNTANDISGLEFKCSDKETLTKDIENALKK